MIGLANIDGSPYLGVYSAVGNAVGVIPPGESKEIKDAYMDKLGLEHIIETTIGGSSVVGSLMVIKNSKAAVSGMIDESEKERLQDYFEVLTIDGKCDAIGNNMVIGRSGIIVNPDMSDNIIESIEEFFNLKVERSTIGKSKVVGSACTANSSGILLHPRATRLEKELVKKHLGYEEVYVGTANYGVPFVGACMVANDNGVLVGENTTGIELNRIEDALLYSPLSH